jgi:hypothetical protein
MNDRPQLFLNLSSFQLALISPGSDSSCFLKKIKTDEDIFLTLIHVLYVFYHILRFKVSQTLPVLWKIVIFLSS